MTGPWFDSRDGVWRTADGDEMHNSNEPFQAWYETNQPGDLVMHERASHSQKEPS